MLQEVDIEHELGIEIAHDDDEDDEVEEKHEGATDGSGFRFWCAQTAYVRGMVMAVAVLLPRCRLRW
jgi:hypothetical protein